MIFAPTNRRIIRPGDKPSFEHTQRYGLIRGHWANTNRVGLWLCNEGSGNRVFDLSVNGTTGTMPGYVPTWGSDKYDSAIVFAGEQYEHVLVSPSPISLGDKYTIVISFNEASQGATRGLLSIGDTQTDSSPLVLLQTNNGDLRMYNDGYTIISAINTNQTYTAVVTEDGTNLKGYLDGVYKASRGSAGTNDNNFYIGQGYTSYFAGKINFVMGWDDVFSASEIALLCREPFLGIQREPRIIYFFVPTGGVVYQELNLTVTAAASVAKTDVHAMVDTGKAVQADAAAAESDTQQMVETGKEVSANAAVSCTDLKVLIETDLAVSADASVSESDTQQMVDTGKEVSADAAASESDTQQMLETGKEVSAVASVSCTDLKVVFELNLEVTASGNVAATDAHTMIETGKSVTAIAIPAVIDTQAMVETGLGISADASVSCTDTMGLLAHIAAFMILRQCT